MGERTDWWCLCGLCLLLTFVVFFSALNLLETHWKTCCFHLELGMILEANKRRKYIL